MTRAEAMEEMETYTMEASALARRLGVEADEFTLNEVVWWYACRNHTGQGSTLYAITCVSAYKRGPFVTFEKLSEETRDLIEAMENDYAHGGAV